MDSSQSDHAALALNLEWYEIRDMLLGRNWVKQDVKRALELATACTHPDACTACTHPDACWLTQIFVGKDLDTKEDARAVFLAQGKNDARALFFAELVNAVDPIHIFLPRLRQSAELGFALAQACMHFRVGGHEGFSFVSQAASQGEREGFHQLGICYYSGDGCERDLEKAKENFLIAAKLDFTMAMIDYGWCLGESDAQRWRWWGIAAARSGDRTFFFRNFSKQVEQFNSDPSLAAVVFFIGRALRGHVNTEKREIFGISSTTLQIGSANRAIDFFSFQCMASRSAVDMWCLIARRGGVVKDIRLLIANLIWTKRELANYIEKPNEKRCVLQ